jgi:hypothetical protein
MSAFSSKAAIPPAPICELRIRRSGKRRCFENDFLARKKIAGKLGTCASDVARMLELNQCHEERRDPRLHLKPPHGTRRAVWIQ